MTGPGEPVPAQQRLMEFIQERVSPAGGRYTISRLVGDASTRQYFRLITGDESFIIAVYPDPYSLHDFTYYQVYTLFRAIGVPVPEAFIFDGKRGIVMQQDLGDQSLQKRLLGAQPGECQPLLRQVVDLIVRIQEKGTEKCRGGGGNLRYQACGLAFDYEKLSSELDFFFARYLTGYRRVPYQASQKAALYEEFDALARRLAGCPRYLAHRDYHCRNIMLCRDAIYVIDFQDARMGPASYDLVSILKDSIDLAETTLDEIVQYFLSHNHLERADRVGFQDQFELMSLQRLLKALGTYGYQISVRNNFLYQQYIPGTLHRACRSVLKLGDFPEIRALLEREVSL
ncbi:MAG: phosphotransferase [Acidobacteria bacterium]|nr:phosphotransferase [Acidobacteriota bacterium]